MKQPELSQPITRSKGQSCLFHNIPSDRRQVVITSSSACNFLPKSYTSRGADDRAAFVSLLKELRLAFEGEAKTSGQPRLLLSAAVPASFEAIAAGYDVPEVSKYLVRILKSTTLKH